MMLVGGDDVEKEKELVNHPDHYRGTICPHCKAEIVDSADIFDQWWGNDPHLWNAGKYMQRAGRKLDASDTEIAATIRDLKKVVWYVVRAIVVRSTKESVLTFLKTLLK